MNLWQREIENPAPFAQISVGVDNPLFALLRHRAGLERFCLKSGPLGRLGYRLTRRFRIDCRLPCGPPDEHRPDQNGTGTGELGI